MALSRLPGESLTHYAARINAQWSGEPEPEPMHDGLLGAIERALKPGEKIKIVTYAAGSH